MRNHTGLNILTTLAGSLLAAAFLPMAVAFADEYAFTPDTSTFDPTQPGGFPPFFDEVTGTELWNTTDLTTSSTYITHATAGTDAQITFGSVTNNEFLASEGVEIIGKEGSSVPLFDAPAGSEFDFANFGLGFGNAWMDLPAGGTDAGASDLFITPFGDFELFGTGFSDLATVIG